MPLTHLDAESEPRRLKSDINDTESMFAWPGSMLSFACALFKTYQENDDGLVSMPHYFILKVHLSPMVNALTRFLLSHFDISTH